MTQNNKSHMPALQQIRPANFLSFGPDTSALPMESLNVLIGANGSGKSNLLEALAVLRATPNDVRAVVRRGAGAAEWIWKGAKEPAVVDALLNYPKGSQTLRHVIGFRCDEQGFRLEDERVENGNPVGNHSKVDFYYHFQHGQPVVNVGGKKKERRLTRETVDFDASILAQLRDPELYPELTYLAGIYERVRIYREGAFGSSAVFRTPQKADMRNGRLEEDFSNLGLFLNRLRRTPKAKAAIIAGLRDLYDGITDFDVSVEGSTVQVFLTEGDFTIPATRLSDGTLRYLCLLAILCDPNPPPLICIEEPELGLHPDILPKLADLLVQASGHTQIIVTTHSDILVDAMTERPEAVVVVEKHEGKTEMRRLKAEDLTKWLEKYRLGELWTKGQLGGTRW